MRWIVLGLHVLGSLALSAQAFADAPRVQRDLGEDTTNAGEAPRRSATAKPPRAEDKEEQSSPPPASEPPASEPPASEPPASEPPASEPPASEPPASEPPASGMTVTPDASTGAEELRSPPATTLKIFPQGGSLLVPKVGQPRTSALDEKPEAVDEKSFVPFTAAFSLEGALGGSGRLDGGPSGFRDRDRFDVALAIGVWAEPNRSFAYGVEYARTGLGRARSEPLIDSVSVAYDLNTLWGKARFFPWRDTFVRGFAGLGLGLSLEEVRANGTRESSQPFNARPEVFSCSAVTHPTVSLGGSLGLNVDLEKRLAFLVQLDGTAQPITSDVVGDCAVASGSVVNALARVGFAYKWDASGSFANDSSVARASAHR